MMVAVLVLVLALVIAAAERVPRLRFRPTSLLRASLATDAMWLLTFGAVGLAVGAVVDGWLPAAGRAGVARLPLAAQVALALLAIDLGNYAVHWMLHRVDALWAVHRVHHSSLQLDWLVAFRSHVLEQLLRRVTAPLVLLIGSVPSTAVGIAAAIFLGWAMLNHSNLRLPLGPLERVLITPRLHRLHHMPATAERNLGTLFVWWDRWRGTLVHGDPSATAAFGLPRDRDTYPQRWLEQLVAPFTDWLATASRPRRPATDDT